MLSLPDKQAMPCALCLPTEAGVEQRSRYLVFLWGGRPGRDKAVLRLPACRSGQGDEGSVPSKANFRAKPVLWRGEPCTRFSMPATPLAETLHGRGKLPTKVGTGLAIVGETCNRRDDRSSPPSATTRSLASHLPVRSPVITAVTAAAPFSLQRIRLGSKRYHRRPPPRQPAAAATTTTNSTGFGRPSCSRSAGRHCCCRGCCYLLAADTVGQAVPAIAAAAPRRPAISTANTNTVIGRSPLSPLRRSPPPLPWLLHHLGSVYDMASGAADRRPPLPRRPAAATDDKDKLVGRSRSPVTAAVAAAAVMS